MVNENASIITGNHSSCGSPDSKRQLRLLKIELRKFSGEIKDFLTFWSQFQRINDDKERWNQKVNTKSLNIAQPCHIDFFLRCHTDSFVIIVCGWRKTAHSLITLVIKNTKTQKFELKISTLYDRLESYLRALESIGMTRDNYEAMLFPLVES